MNPLDQMWAHFHEWENRGRGKKLYDAPVRPEPPFVAFLGHGKRLPQQRDTGRRSSFTSRLRDAFVSQFDTRNPLPVEATSQEEEPNWLGEEEIPCVEFTILLPKQASYGADTMIQFLRSLELASAPLAFEIAANANSVWVALVATTTAAEMVWNQLEAHFPEATISLHEPESPAWLEEASAENVVLDFGLAKEFMWSLPTSQKSDPFVGLVGSMANLHPGESAVYQVIFAPIQEPWAEAALQSIMQPDGKSYFEDGSKMVKSAVEKFARPLYGVTVRLAAHAETLPRAWEILRGLAPSIGMLSGPSVQGLIPLSNDDYADVAHVEDLALRCSRRSGMILNIDELVGLIHFPTAAVRSEKFARVPETTTRAAPITSDINAITLGLNEHLGETTEVQLSGLQRLQHMHLIGASGTGKSTLILSMILQDLQSGQGFALLDPHGDLIDLVLSQIPPDRLDDVVLIDPSDEQHIVPFNVLSAHSDYEKTLLASDLVSVFRRLSTTWGDRMNIIFQNLVLAFLEHRDGGTLADMRRFLVDADWRGNFLQGVEDPDVQFYWQQTFPKLDGAKSVGPILTRLETLLTPKIVRYMVSQKANRIDFSEIMDRGRILLVRLPMGQIGKESTFMLGSLIMVKIQQMAMGRARVAAKERRPFICYVDECQHFVTPSMSEILAGARKYGLGLVLAHQEMQQLSANSDVAAAVMTNAATRIVFRVSENDGRALKGDFAHYEPKDFAELPNLHAIARIGRADQDFNLEVIRPEDVEEHEAEEGRQAAVEASRRRYTVPRTDVEAEIRRQMAADGKNPKPQKTTKQEPAKTASPPVEPELKLGTSQVSPVPSELVAAVEAKESEPPEISEVQPETIESLAPEEPAAASTRAAGMGRGGQDHQTIVEQLAGIGTSLGYAASKEATAANGRADLALISIHRRIAFEVAVNSNTAHEIENIEKCLEGGFDFVVSISPNQNTLKNIERAAKKSFTDERLAKVKFLLPNEVADWLSELANSDAPSPAPETSNTKKIGGRTVRVQRVEMSPSERKAMSEQQIEAIAAIVNHSKSEGN